MTTNNEGLGRVRGLVSMVGDIVDHGSSTVEEVHLATAARPFTILELFPGIRTPVRGIRVIHDEATHGTYEIVRKVSRLVVQTANSLLDLAEEKSAEAAAVSTDATVDSVEGAQSPPEQH